MESLAGKWLLTDWSAVWAFQLDGSADEFLYQEPTAALPRTDDEGEVRGSTLSIGPDGNFSQAGECDRPILTYDDEGIQVRGVAEFSGVVREDGGRGYLLTSSATRAGNGRQRYDDGDTRVCDSVQMVGGRLVRTICVITNECYGDRVVLVYDRA